MIQHNEIYRNNGVMVLILYCKSVLLVRRLRIAGPY